MSEVVTRREPSSGAIPAQTRRWWIAALLFLVLGAGGAGVIASGALRAPSPAKPDDSEKRTESAKDTITMAKDKQSAAGVDTALVLAAPLRVNTWRTGRVALNDERVAHICPPVEGIVREVPVRLGHNVAASDVLAVIDCRELSSLKLELVRARAALATEREAATRTRTTTTNAAELLKLLATDTPLTEIEKKLTDKPIGDWRAQLLGAYTRKEQLRTQLASLRSSAGAVPESVALKVQSEADAANATYTSLVEDLRYQVKYQVRQAELKLREAETAVDITRAKLVALGLAPETIDTLDPLAEGAKASLLTIRAPFAGTVVEKHVVLSERVGPQSQLFVLSDLSTVWIQADVFEADLPLIRRLAGRTVVFRSDLAGISERTATVVYTGDVIDKSSRTLTLTAETPNPERALKPGTMVEVGFDTGTSDPVIQVPASAVLRHENKPFVFVVTGTDTFAKREVALGRQAGEAVEITDGVRVGEAVVVRGGFVLKSELLKDQMVGE